MTRWLSLPLTVLALLALCPTAPAGEQVTQDELLKVIQQQNEKIDALLGRVKSLEDSQDTVRQAISEGFQRTESLADKLDNAAEGGVPPWVNRTRFFGDFRYRHEYADKEILHQNRTRHRIRVRIGLQAHPCDDLDFYFRLASGDSDRATTRNQTLDGVFSAKDVWLDLAYIDWHPQLLYGVHILAGKMKNPFMRAGGEGIIFDSDVNPEGVALAYSFQPIEITKIFASGGGFWLGENPSGRDSMLWGAQAGVTQGIGDYVKVTVGSSYYDFGKTKGEPVFGAAGGNTTGDHNAWVDTDGDGEPDSPPIRHLDTYYGDPMNPKRVFVYGEPDLYYMYNYQPIEFFTEITITPGPIPIVLFGSTIKNDAAGAPDDKAWITGVRVGKTRGKAGSWEIGYNYRRVEPDAVLAALGDPEGGMSADTQGHKLSGSIMLTRCMKFTITYWKTKLGMTRPEDIDNWERDNEVIQFDLSLSF